MTTISSTTSFSTKSFCMDFLADLFLSKKKQLCLGASLLFLISGAGTWAAFELNDSNHSLQSSDKASTTCPNLYIHGYFHDVPNYDTTTNLTLELGDGEIETLWVNDDSSFEFSTPLCSGESYTISLDENSTCDIYGSTQGVTDDSNITDIHVDCSTVWYESEMTEVRGYIFDDRETRQLYHIYLQFTHPELPYDYNHLSVLGYSNSSFQVGKSWLVKGEEFMVYMGTSENDKRCKVLNPYGVVSGNYQDITNIVIQCGEDVRCGQKNVTYVGCEPPRLTLSGHTVVSSSSLVSRTDQFYIDLYLPLWNLVVETVEVHHGEEFSFISEFLAGGQYEVRISNSFSAIYYNECEVINGIGSFETEQPVTNMIVLCD